MAETGENVLVSVDIVDNFIDAQRRVDGYKQSAKNLSDNIRDLEKRFTELASKENATAEEQKELISVKKRLNDAIKQQNEYLAENAKNIARANNDLRDAKKTLESTVRTEDLLNSIGEKTNQTLGEMQRELSALRNTPFEGVSKENAEAIKQRMADLQAQIQDYKDEIKGLDTGEVWANVAAGAQTASAGVQLVAQSFRAVGIESESLDKLNALTVQLISTTQAFGVITEYLQKRKGALLVANVKAIAATVSETLARKAATAQANAEAAAENGSTAAKLKGVVATKAITAAQRLWNAAISANPVMLLVVAATALVAAIGGVVAWMNRETAAAKESRVAEERLNQTLKDGEIIRERINNKYSDAIEKRTLAGRKEIAELRKNGATEAEILKAQAKIDEETTDLKLKGSRAMVDQMKYELGGYNETIAAMERERDEARMSAGTMEELIEKIKTQTAARDALKASIEREGNVILGLEQDNVEREQTLTKQTKEANKTRVDAAISAYEKELESQRSYYEAQLKAEAGFQSADFKTRQDYARRLFNLNQATEYARLANQRKYGKITEAEYARSLEIMAAQLAEFSNGQVAELDDFFKSEREAILGMLTQTMDEQIADAEQQYADAMKRLEKIEPPKMMTGESQADYDKRFAEYEKFELKRVTTAIRLEEERDRRIQDIRDNALAKQIKDIEDSVQKAYSGDLAKYQDNEREKLDVLEKMLRAQIKAKKDAGLETYNEEARLDSIASQRTALNLNRDLILANGNAKARYDAKVKALNAELALAGDNADKQLEIQQRLADADRELLDARIASFQEWAGAAGDLMGGFSDLFNASLDAELQKTRETYDAEVAALEDQKNRGLITEETFNKQKEKLDKKMAKEEARMERERAIRDKAAGAFEIGISTAVSILNSAEKGFPAAIPFVAMSAALGAVQLAALLATPLPKAARGGLISGPSHLAGGAVIEAEGGEAIINKRSVSLFGPALSAINELGGGVPFARPYSDGGYVSRSLGAAAGATAEEIAAAMRNVQIYTTVEDINRGQSQYAKIQAAGKISG